MPPTGDLRRPGYSRAVPRRVALVVLAAALAGCGTVHRGPFRLAPTRECLQDAQARLTTRKLGVIAESAPNGAVRAFVGPRNVTLSFAATNRGAIGLARAYERFGPRNTRDLVFVARNVVLLWDVTPDPDTRKTVENCLRS